MMSILSFGQEGLIHCSDSTFCIPGVQGVPRSKGFVVSYEFIGSNEISATSDELSIGNGNGEIDVNKRLDVRFRFPVLNHEKFKLALGVHYYNEEFEFSDLDNPEYTAFQRLNDRNLKSIGTSIYMVRPFLGNKYIVFRGAFNLNGDYEDSKNLKDFTKVSLVPLYGVKINPYTSMAFGVALSFDFGDPAIYPVFIYNKTFNNRWGLELTLPVEARVRHTFNKRNLLYAGVKLQGNGYNITLDPESELLVENETIQLSKSELKYNLNYEREIHDYLWFGINGGLRSSLNFDLTSVHRLKTQKIIESDLGIAPFINLSIFVVPPQKWLD